MTERGGCAVLVRGDFACFSRPEFKTERMSYPLMTPSAARGILEAIFWKPEIRWEVTEIAVLNPIRTMNVLRNEVRAKQGPSGVPFIVEEHRQQRTSLILRDVAYVISSDLVTQPGTSEPLSKYTSQFADRVLRGRFHHAPVLGTREFAAEFEPTTGREQPLSEDLDIGPMLFDLAFVPDPKRRELSWRSGEGASRQTQHGYARAIFFDARLERGRLRIPAELHRRKAKLEDADAA
jgi:CRISPR-associated protein Cas5d